MSGFATFLRWEEKSRDTIDFKKAYVDMAGDVVAGLMLSQIVFWHLPDRGGADKLRVERDGRRWLVKTRGEWWHECRLNPREVDRARKALEARGVIEVRLYKFNGSPTQHLRIREERFLQLWQEVLGGETLRARRKFNRGGGGERGGDTVGLEAPAGEAGGANPQGSRANPPESPISLISEIHFTDRGNGINRLVKSNSPISENHRTEITSEITSETAAPEDGRAAARDADAALVELLVGHGVGRSVARKFARDKPEVCRRCLEHLPYARFKTTRGAWLANAIRDEYGPPPGYEEARARQQRAREGALLQDARQSREEARKREKEAWLRATYGRLEKERGEAYTAFSAYVAGERVRAARIAGQLSARRREEHLAAFDRPERRLQLFEDWLQGQGRRFAPSRPITAPAEQAGLESAALPTAGSPRCPRGASTTGA